MHLVERSEDGHTFSFTTANVGQVEHRYLLSLL
jgi:hypothetical protein